MKRRAAVCCLALALAGCTAPDVTWSASLDLGARFAQTSSLSIVSAGEAVIVPSGQAIHGFDATSGKERWTVTMPEDVRSCARAGQHALCQVGKSTVAVDATGKTETRAGLLVEGEANGKVYFSRAEADGVVLVEQDGKVPLAELGINGTVLARFDGRSAYLPNGEKIAADAGGNYPDVIENLVSAGVLRTTSAWLNPPAHARLAQPLTDGFLIVEPGQITVAKIAPTKVTIFDRSGKETGRHTIAPALHMDVNPSWSQETVTDLVSRLNALTTTHAFVFSDARVVGFDETLSSAVAPSFANVEGLTMADGTRLSTEAIAPESLALRVGHYPYVSVTGKAGATPFAATFDVTTGKRVVDGKKCQWEAHTYCFSSTALERVALD